MGCSRCRQRQVGLYLLGTVQGLCTRNRPSDAGVETESMMQAPMAGIQQLPSEQPSIHTQSMPHDHKLCFVTRIMRHVCKHNCPRPMNEFIYIWIPVVLCRNLHVLHKQPAAQASQLIPAMCSTGVVRTSAWGKNDKWEKVQGMARGEPGQARG